ncbi:hypothetical protein GCM10010109_80960 [Actinoplanes campanulatus]|nr:hypothetical protein GCM10010109_80960 [Actinoplanes campanulatus]GID41196.1 hypothetical protein Aca09nite_77020 [Actinoplanes campanulatus]
MLLAWLTILGGAIFAGLTAPAAPADDFSMPGTESQQTFELLQERFPGLIAESAEARVVFVAPDGQQVTSEPYKSVIDTAVAQLGQGGQVDRVDDPFESHAVSDDKTAAYATVTFEVAASSVNADSRADLDAAAGTARASGLTVEAGGDALEAGGPAGIAELVAIGLAAVILFITLGSLVAAGLPLVTALIGVAVSMLSLLAVSDAFGLSSTSTTAVA